MSTKKTVKNGESQHFEAIYAELESLISQLENSDSMSLEASLKAFESGIKLTRVAQGALSKAEQKVQPDSTVRRLLGNGIGAAGKPFRDAALHIFPGTKTALLVV